MGSLDFKSLWNLVGGVLESDLNVLIKGDLELFNSGSDVALTVKDGAGTEVIKFATGVDNFINAGQNFGVGTDTPIKPLHVIASAYNTGIAVGEDNATDILLIGYDNTNNIGVLQSFAAGSFDDLSLQPNGGNVAIGSLNATNLLHVGSGNDTTVQTYDGITVQHPGAAQVVARNTSNNVELGMFAHVSIGYMGTFTNHELRFTVNNSDKAVIDTSGRMAIGDVTADTLLHLFDDSAPLSGGQNILKLEADGYNSGIVGSGSRIVFKYRGGVQETAAIRSYTFGVGASGLSFDTGWGAVASRMIIDNNGRVAIGNTSPNTSSILDLESTSGALLIPRMTTTEKNALTAVNGMLVYDATLNKFQGYENGAWASLI